MTLLTLFVQTLIAFPAHAHEKTFRCLAKSEAAVVMIRGAFESSTNEPTESVRLVGSTSTHAELAPNALGTPEDPRFFSPEDLTMENEAEHGDFIVTATHYDASQLRLNFSQSGGHLELGMARGPGRPAFAGMFEDVTCRFKTGADDAGWNWSGREARWPYNSEQGSSK